MEIVAPVVEGRTRAAQDNTQQAGAPQTDFHKAMPIIIHGDAAYPGQGINFETMNLGDLKATQLVVLYTSLQITESVSQLNQQMAVQQHTQQMLLKVMMFRFYMLMLTT